MPDFETLPTSDDEATYHLASVGWLRKHLGWTKDDKSNDEPGWSCRRRRSRRR